MLPAVGEPQYPPLDIDAISVNFGGGNPVLTALWSSIVLLVLSTALLGLFTALALLASLVLVQKGLRRPQTSVLLTVILVMYASAVLHWTTLLLNLIAFYNIAQAYGTPSQCQFTNGETYRLLRPTVILPPNPSSCPGTMATFGLPNAVYGFTVCAPTALLTVNVMLGDAIVWWRVWAIWPRNLIVRITCIVLLVATLAMGIIDTLDSCSMAAFFFLSVLNLTEVPSGSFYQSDFFGLAALALSLATNMVATILILYKALEHAEIMGSVPLLNRSSQVEKILIILVESGTIYCVIWVCVLAHEAALLGTGPVGPSEQKVLDQPDYFIKGCLISLIGMYPTVIIILVALNKSLCHGTSLGNGPVSSISFRNPITTTSARTQQNSLPTGTSRSRPQRDEQNFAAGLNHWSSDVGQGALESMN